MVNPDDIGAVTLDTESLGGLTASSWRQIVDSALDTAIISVDLSGRVKTWSAGAERLLGWAEAEMSDAISAGRGGGDEGWRVRKDGSRFWAVGEMSPIRDARGVHVGYVKVLRDRTPQRDS